MTYTFEGKVYTVISEDRIEFNDDGNYETKVKCEDGQIYNMIFDGDVPTDQSLTNDDIISVGK